MSDASGVIPQIAAVFGKCGGGLAVMAAMADFTFMEKNDARLFVNSPNAIEGNSTANAIPLPHSSRVKKREMLISWETKQK